MWTLEPVYRVLLQAAVYHQLGGSVVSVEHGLLYVVLREDYKSAHVFEIIDVEPAYHARLQASSGGVLSAWSLNWGWSIHVCAVAA